MQSQGSTSSQPSSDSLSSNNSLPFSDSEQVEDDADVFLTARSRSVLVDEDVAREYEPEGLGNPASRWAFPGFNGRADAESDRSDGALGQPRAEEGEREGEKSEGELLFAQKCAELQGFVRPLLQLLHGLKKGRFDRGLSSFQQNIAMDRIQRIVGVLQRPNGGEQHLNVMLQVEMMLKQWFPQVCAPVAPRPSSTPAPLELSPPETPGRAPQPNHRDQLHIPVKKRRHSWTGLDTPPTLLKRLLSSGGEEWGRQEGEERESPPPSDAEGVFRNAPDPASTSQQEESGERGEPGRRASDRSKSALASASPKPRSPREGETGAREEPPPFPVIPSPTSGDSPDNQDSSVSSTTSYDDAQNQQQPMGCHSQPVAGQTRTLETCQDLSPGTES